MMLNCNYNTYMHTYIKQSRVNRIEIINKLEKNNMRKIINNLCRWITLCHLLCVRVCGCVCASCSGDNKTIICGARRWFSCCCCFNGIAYKQPLGFHYSGTSIQTHTITHTHNHIYLYKNHIKDASTDESQLCWKNSLFCHKRNNSRSKIVEHLVLVYAKIRQQPN